MPSNFTSGTIPHITRHGAPGGCVQAMYLVLARQDGELVHIAQCRKLVTNGSNHWSLRFSLLLLDRPGQVGISDHYRSLAVVG